MPASDSSTPTETSSLLGLQSQPETEQNYLTNHRTPPPKNHTTSSNPDTSSPSASKSSHPKPPPPPSIPKADTDLSWGTPAGLPIPPSNDENLVIFRRAVGINTTIIPPNPSQPSESPRSLEECRHSAKGIYLATIKSQTSTNRLFYITASLIYFSYFVQILVGATLTALGPSAGEHETLITALGAINTVLAGVLALLKGQGLPGKLKRRAVELRKLQDWIEQTEALLAVGVIGRDRKEVGLLVQVAFKKYNAAEESEEMSVGISDSSNFVNVRVSDHGLHGRDH
ncbi:hypothetical protein QBC43DRAFT_198645 [Cladorrhinum sp. PSN259]|nr:hypothetical protein QBC43DRAFT_198645 [Cladorrhinum sp. PSN259]